MGVKNFRLCTPLASPDSRARTIAGGITPVAILCRHCGTAAHPIFKPYVGFRSVYCFHLIFIYAFTKHDDNMSSLHKTYSTSLNIGHLFVYVREAP